MEAIQDYSLQKKVDLFMTAVCAEVNQSKHLRSPKLGEEPEEIEGGPILVWQLEKKALSGNRGRGTFVFAHMMLIPLQSRDQSDEAANAEALIVWISEYVEALREVFRTYSKLTKGIQFEAKIGSNSYNNKAYHAIKFVYYLPIGIDFAIPEEE